ncbi:MAG TPA: hypothetical protein VHB99_03005 [Pirellulales bacterium]|nr:hypothetical protein [Pirellulales bacterium]
MPKTQLLFDLAEAIGGGDVAGTLKQVDAIITGGLAADSLIASLVDHLRNLLILRACGAKADLVEVPGLAMADLVKQAEKFDAITLSQDIAILEELRRQVRVTQAGRALIDATFVRLALAEQFANVADLLAGGTPASPVQKKKFEIAENLAPSPGISGEGSEPAAVASTDEDDSLPAVGKVFEGPKRSMFAAFKAAAAKPQAVEAPNIEPVAPEEFADRWAAVLGELKQASPLVHGVLSQGRLVGVEDSVAVVEINAQLETHIRGFEKNGKKDVIRQAIADSFGAGIGVAFRVTEANIPAKAASGPTDSSSAARSIAQPPQRSAPASPPLPQRVTAEQKEAARQDPYVRSVLELFGGEIVRVEPKES